MVEYHDLLCLKVTLPKSKAALLSQPAPLAYPHVVDRKETVCRDTKWAKQITECLLFTLDEEMGKMFLIPYAIRKRFLYIFIR